MEDMFTYQSEAPSRNEKVAVGTSSEVVAERRTAIGNRRKKFLIRNVSPNSTDIITLSLGPSSSVADNGIVLRQYEAYGEDDVDKDCFQGTISAICATATGQLSIQER